MAEKRVLITLDKDYGLLTVPTGVRHHGIIRLVDVSTANQPRFCLALLEKWGEDLANGALLTASPGRVRIRKADPSTNL